MHRIFAPLTLALLAIHPAFAQTRLSPPPSRPSASVAARALTLPQALEMAWRLNPELSAAQNEILAIEGVRTQAGTYPNPTLGFEVEDVRPQTRTSTLLLTQPIELGGKRAARIEAAERARDIAAVQLAARRSEVRSAVTAAYFAALIAQERERLAEASLQLACTAREAARKRVAAGKVSPIEETKARVAEANVRLEQVQAQSELRSSLQNLKSTIGTQDVAVDRLDGSAEALPPVRPVDSLEQRVADAPVLRRAFLEARRQGALVELEQARRIPDVTVSVGARRARDNFENRTQAIVAVSIPLPFFDTNKGNIVEALRRQDKARDEALALQQRLLADAYVAQQRLNTAREAAQVLQREVLPGATEALVAATKGFELGKFSFLETLDAQRTLFQARAQYLRALAEAHGAAADLDRLIGDPTDAGFTRSNGTAEGSP